jgi:release factor glutamine methyltransferase
LQRREIGEPLAYILGRKEFRKWNFVVSPSVLIPRVETETAVGLVLKYSAGFSQEARILDLCTGSGVIGISVKLENPKLDVVMSDISREALDIAELNATRLKADVKMVYSDLFAEFSEQKFDLIVSNPPYVDRDWEWVDEQNLRFEPEDALYAEDFGLDLIKKIILQVSDHLNESGFLILESDPIQHEKISEFAVGKGFALVEKKEFYLVFRK